MSYLEYFQKRLAKRWKGSLVSVREAKEIDRNAKKYLNELAKAGEIDKVVWGWYWVPDVYDNFLDFLAKDKHFKVLQKQSAAAFWNGDFIHRDYLRVAVRDPGYGKALEAFATGMGWKVRVETRELKEGQYDQYKKMAGVPVEGLEETIVDCVKEWAFADALASVHQNYEAIDWDRIWDHSWERVAGSDVRVGQVLKYGTAMMGQAGRSDTYATSRAFIADEFVRRQVDEAAMQVIELA
jgi:predicted transcriptional regulator of viral defense system